MFREIVLSIFEPGVNRSTKFFTYGIFLSLILVIITLLAAVGFNIHLVFLLVLASFLLLAVIWFVEEIQQIKSQQTTEEKKK